jgi:hypothetical protein
MVHLSWAGKPESDLVGMFIFHAVKGGIPLISGPPYGFGNINIGSHLGEVVEVSGPNRIYYLDKSRVKKYVSRAGIGCVCSTVEEVEKIDDIRNEAFEDFKTSLARISNSVESSIQGLL